MIQVMRMWLAWVLVVVISAAANASEARRIVTLAPNLAELAFAAGAGERVVGVVQYSDYPEAALRIAHVGDAFRVDSEKILALRPDLVLAWESGTPRAVIEKLQALGLNVAVVQVSRLAQVGDALRTIGKLAGTGAVAEAAARDFEKKMAALKERYANRPRLRVFIEVDRQPLFTVNGNHVTSEIVQLCGGENVFAGIGQLAASIGTEAVIGENPDVILSTANDAEGVRNDWRRWSDINAVRYAHVYQMNPDTLVRATPRLVEGAEQACNALEQARRTR